MTEYLNYFDPQEYEDGSPAQYALTSFYGAFALINGKWIFDKYFGTHLDSAMIDGESVNPVIEDVPYEKAPEATKRV